MHYLSLPSGGKCQVTYVWVNQEGLYLQSKTRTLASEPTGIEDIPEWCTTYTSNELSEELLLVPVKMFRDPFTLDPNMLVLCETFLAPCVPFESNHRTECVKALETVKEMEPWFGMEQEYILYGLDGLPFGWPAKQCSISYAGAAVGLNKAYGRDICMSHYKACLYAGLEICGTTAEAVPSQWEFQIGPCEGIELADHVWMARYILNRVCEDFGVVPSFDPKPIPDITGASCGHMNFSTKDMRSEGGIKHIEEAIKKLSLRHREHVLIYDPSGGADNKKRLHGKSVYSSFTNFTSGVADRTASIRIPGQVSRNGCGYFEDRRPPANCDPYIVTQALVETCLPLPANKKQ